MSNQGHIESSPDESIRAERGANVNVNRITLPPTRDLVLGTIIALSIMGNVFLFAYAKDAKTQAWVAQDAVQKFQTTQLPDLQTRIGVAEELVKAYGLKESVDEHHHHQPGAREQAVGSDRRPDR